ncbi:long-chain-fatty-acid--CoA ligase [Cupriavidus taiwanensis]|uniref:long-chain-fatty-acid--CoA ligase n=1 Tax=Cupriavidus taiwanensis TaxID=164546 RepID=UPI000E18DEF5|nr:long-chain-fatty-acid--CoA ligase [Cupriavidus taiwanensis]SOZ29654.1 AMP-dependent synthetase and ligase [Cupriavidus taiwanensis]SPA34465.1 AMP-dependent synthetase and ligase [Cupriavidus taiwanensis]
MESKNSQIWPKRLPRSIRPPQTSLVYNLEVSARRHPDKTAMVFFGHETTYAELWEKVQRLAGWLHCHGVGKGDRVILLMQNCPQWVIAYHAILLANAVVVPVNPMNRADELGHYITDADAKVAIVAADLAGELGQASAALDQDQQLQLLLTAQYRDMMPEASVGPGGDAGSWREWLGSRHPAPVLPNGRAKDWSEAVAFEGARVTHTVAPDDIAILSYTSGTTGAPKGCIHPHATLMHNIVASGLWTQGSAENSALLVIPMFHITGMLSMLLYVYSGATIVLMPRWNRDVAGALIAQWRIAQWVNIPTMITDLLASPHFSNYDLSSLAHIGGGGAPMPEAVAKRLLEEYGLQYIEGYGLTETAGPTHFNPLTHPKLQCLGIPFIGVTARVVDPATFAELPTGEVGEIVVSGPGLFHGYWKNAEATDAVFVELDGYRFFRTGDMGYVDLDGYFFLTDRLKRMINASGYKVWPSEVETLMLKHPSISEACIVGTKDAYRGESVKAIVVLRAAAREHTNAQEIIDWCYQHMAAYKVPREVEFIDSLPKSASGKVMWRQLQESQLH